MTATIIQYPADWQKFLITIATSGRVIEGWEIRIGGRRANILKNDGRFLWRTYAAIEHQKPPVHQRFRPLGDWTSSPSLFIAMAVAKEIASLTR